MSRTFEEAKRLSPALAVALDIQRRNRKRSGPPTPKAPVEVKQDEEDIELADDELLAEDFLFEEDDLGAGSDPFGDTLIGPSGKASPSASGSLQASRAAQEKPLVASILERIKHQKAKDQ